MCTKNWFLNLQIIIDITILVLAATILLLTNSVDLSALTHSALTSITEDMKITETFITTAREISIGATWFGTLHLFLCLILCPKS